MSKQIKTKKITLTQKSGKFSVIFHKTRGIKKNSGILTLRRLLTNEKARLLHTIKTKNPDSIYALAKLLGRDFKAVRQDIRLLEQFGVIELISAYKKGREHLKPIVDISQLNILINL